MMKILNCERCPHLELNPFKLGTIVFFSNSRTLVILLQVDLVSGDESETVYEGFYETKDTSIFARSSILDSGQYCWLHDLIHQLPPNSKVDYLIPTIRCILNFFQL
jgi:hypothetical protein